MMNIHPTLFTILMLQKKKYVTSTTRFASVIKIYDHTHPKNLTKQKVKTNLKLHKKRFFRPNNILISQSLKLNYAGVVQSYTYNKRPYQLIINIKTIFNNHLCIPGIELLLPGKKIFDLTKELAFNKVQYTGTQILLKDLPYHLFVSYLMNNYNNKWTFIKSSGTFGMKLKAKKTVKLIVVKLPSTLTYFFIKTTRCFIGKNANFFNNKFIEGKWGFSLHKTKRQNVRGVAMNPVDHPNGGRTKAKQPEKSPWGWIAKNKK